MEALFFKLVNMSITASWLVLAIIAVRLVFKKAPKWILCLLWGLVAFRLVCPFSIESGLSLIPDAEPLSRESAYTPETGKQAHGDILDSEGNVIVERNLAAKGDILDSEGNVIVEVEDGHRTYPEEEQVHGWMYFLSRIWLAGFAVMLAYTAVSYYLLKQKVSTAIPLVKGIKQSEYVDSPFVLGIIRPVIYLPFDMSEADCAYVIAHEKAHIRRRDHWWKPLGFLLLSVYWFNPVLWVAYILLCRDIEAACDEKVIQDMEKDERRAYSTALLNCSIHRHRIAACPLAFGETGVKARVKSVMNYKKPAFWVIVIAVVMSIIVSVCFLTNPERDNSWIKANPKDTTLELEWNLETPIQSYAIYEDIYEEGTLISSMAIVSDNFQDNGGATQRQTNLRLDVQPVKARNDNLSGELSVHLECAGSSLMVRKLPKEYYTGMVHKMPEISSSIFNKKKVNSEDNITLLTILLSTDPEGNVADHADKDTLVQKNDTVVIYRLVLSETNDAELANKNVFTWFDLDANEVSYRHPKDTTLDLPGMEGTIVSYNASKNEIRIIDTDGARPIIATDLMIRSAYLTDLTGDSISEICATIETDAGMVIQVFDPVEQQLYELSGNDGSYFLTSKADKLCVLLKDIYWITLDYGILGFSNDLLGGKKLEIQEIDSSLEALTKKISSIDVMNRKLVSISNPQEIEKIMGILESLKQQVQPASDSAFREAVASASADVFGVVTITINNELGEKTLNFSEDYSVVWEYGSSEGYQITDPESLKFYVEALTDGVHRNETSGEPFAAVDAPWDWCKYVTSDSIESAKAHVCRYTYKNGSYYGSGGTSGILSYDTLQNLLSILNQIPKDAFKETGMARKSDYHGLFIDQQRENSSVALVDGVNDLAIIINYHGGETTILLTNEMEKVRQDDGYFLEPTPLWSVQDQRLTAFMEEIFGNPPVITYFVGSEYDWQSALQFTDDNFALKLFLIEGWEHEYVRNQTNSGIRCRPDGVTEGWIYFSFWPNGYEPVEEDRYYFDGFYNDRLHRVSYPASVSNETGIDTRNAIWSYQYDDLVDGDYAIINDGADSWFLEYQDQIGDIITLSSFTVE